MWCLCLCNVWFSICCLVMVHWFAQGICWGGTRLGLTDQLWKQSSRKDSQRICHRWLQPSEGMVCAACFLVFKLKALEKWKILFWDCLSVSTNLHRLVPWATSHHWTLLHGQCCSFNNHLLQEYSTWKHFFFLFQKWEVEKLNTTILTPNKFR